MKLRVLILLGLLLILGVLACNSNELPAATPAGFLLPKTSLRPSNTPTKPTPTNTAFPAVTQIPTNSSTAPASAAPLSATPLACQETTGSIQERELESNLLNDSLEYLVYLPPCYHKELDQRYPVVYLIHGQTYSYRHWLDLGAAEIADRLISNEELAPFLMVFPFDRNHFDPPADNPFGQAVLFELIPAIEKEFRVVPTRSSRAIGGISRGGNWAAHLSLQHPELFGAVGLHSTPIFSSDTNPEIIEWLEAIPIDEFPRLYIDIGESDRWLKYTLIFEEVLDNASIPHEWHLYPGYHEDEYWESHLEEYLRWYAQDW